ncbi:MAG: OmpA family protein [Paludibacteraceae bacterium]|nr:OmpA family protein [Paludibacteraceae bacterium]
MILRKIVLVGLFAITTFQVAIAQEELMKEDSSSVKFEWSYYNIEIRSPQDSVQFDEMAEFISRFPADTFLVVGHTGSCDGLEHSLHKLSWRRAKYVRQALVDRGVDPERVKFIGCGGKEPKVPNNKTLLDYEQNIRVTLEFYSPQRVEEIEKYKSK